jgi:hypothetical protein
MNSLLVCITVLRNSRNILACTALAISQSVTACLHCSQQHQQTTTSTGLLASNTNNSCVMNKEGPRRSSRASKKPDRFVLKLKLRFYQPPCFNYSNVETSFVSSWYCCMLCHPLQLSLIGLTLKYFWNFNLGVFFKGCDPTVGNSDKKRTIKFFHVVYLHFERV